VHPDKDNAVTPVVFFHNLMGDASQGTVDVFFIQDHFFWHEKSPYHFAGKGIQNFALLTFLPLPLASLSGLDLKVQPLTVF
jgi:hypothetical protein